MEMAEINETIRRLKIFKIRNISDVLFFFPPLSFMLLIPSFASDFAGLVEQVCGEDIQSCLREQQYSHILIQAGLTKVHPSEYFTKDIV